MLLLGRYIIRVHKVRKQVNGLHNAQYAQKLDLGWVIVGNECIGDVHKPSVVTSCYNNILKNGCPSLLETCPKSYTVKERYCCDNPISVPSLHKGFITCEGSDADVFHQTKDDDLEAPSIEDVQFLTFIDREVHQDEKNIWVAPLPFRTWRPQVPSNRLQALKRLHSLL